LVKNCSTNQAPRSHLARRSAKVTKKKRKISDLILTLGKRTRYAPMTPAMAPDAPTTGTVLPGCTAT